MHRRPQIIGYRKTGAPIYEIMGGSGEGDDQGTGNGGQVDDSGKNDDAGKDDVDDAGNDDSGDSGDDEDEDDEPLGPKGEKALAAEKDKRKAAAKRARDAERERDEARAEIEKLKSGDKGDGKDDDKSGRDADATKKANLRILRSEIKAAAKGVLADPSDAYKFLDLDDFDVSDEGDVDEDEIADALAELVKDKPYLSAQGGDGKRFQGSNNGGPRNAGSQKRQLTEADIDKMSPADIEKARVEGRLDRLMGKKK